MCLLSLFLIKLVRGFYLLAIIFFKNIIKLNNWKKFAINYVPFFRSMMKKYMNDYEKEVFQSLTKSFKNVIYELPANGMKYILFFYF